MDQRIKKLHVTRYTLHVTGLTLIEVVVSLGVLMVGLSATVTLIVSTLSYSQRNENAIVVVNLAREGIETIRAIRDTTVQGFVGLPSGAWVVDGNTTALNTDSQANAQGTFTIGACTNCKLALVSGRYVKSTGQGTQTPYSRAVQVSDVNLNTEKKVVSTVQWTEHNRTHTFQLESRLFNWR